MEGRALNREGVIMDNEPVIQPVNTGPAIFALAAYLDASGTGPDVMGEDITFLVVDLLLLAEENNIDPGTVMRNAMLLIEEHNGSRLND